MEKLRDLKHLLVTVFMAGFGMFVVVPTITDVTLEAVCPGRDQCSLAIYLTGFQQAITGFGAMIMTPLIGNWSDKYGRKTLLTLPLTLSIIPTVMLAYKRSTNFFYAYYVIKIVTAMVSDVALMSLALAYAADKFIEGPRITAFGIVCGLYTASSVCGNLTARFLSIDATCKVAAFVSILAAVYMRIFLEESIRHGNDHLSQPMLKEEELGSNDDAIENVSELPTTTTQTFKTLPSLKDVICLIRSSPTFSQAGIVSFFNNLAFCGTQTSLLYFLKAHLQFNKDQFADVMVILGVLGTISQMIVMPLLSPAIGEKRLLSIGLFSFFAHLFVVSISWSTWVAYAATVFTLLFWCVNPSISSIVSKEVGPNEQGKAQGCIAGIQSFANIISPLVFSPLTALFLSVDAPFHFPGFSILCLGFSALVAFGVSLMIKVNPSSSS